MSTWAAGTSSGTSASTLILVACIAVAGVLVTAGIQWWVGRRTSSALKTSAEAAKANAEAARISAEAAARSAQAAQDAVRVNAESVAGVARRAEADAHAKLYQEAAAQLGHQSAAVRLAGVYAMARLADAWDDQRQQCAGVLCAYLRLPWPDARNQPANLTGDMQVREAIAQLIGERLRTRSLVDWQRIPLNLIGARLSNFELRKPIFDAPVFISDATIERDVQIYSSNVKDRLLLDCVRVKGLLWIDNLSLDAESFFSLDEMVVAKSGKTYIDISHLSAGADISGDELDIAGSFGLSVKASVNPQGTVDLSDVELRKGALINLKIASVTDETPYVAHVSFNEEEIPPGSDVFYSWGAPGPAMRRRWKPSRLSRSNRPS